MIPLIVIGVVLAIGFAVLAAYLQAPLVRGKRGEKRVRTVLGETQEGLRYVFNDFKITDEGMSCQIDHILINQNGVFVIETKNYSGNIYGTDEQREWTQVLAYGKVKNKIYNPVKQNNTHLYRLRKILPKEFPLISIVVFVQNNTQHINSKIAIPLYSLYNKIETNNGITLSSEQIQEAAKLLHDAQAAEMTNAEHIENIHVMRDKIAHNICPRCGGKLVLRQGKYGQFYGCENYPKCKFIKKL